MYSRLTTSVAAVCLFGTAVILASNPARGDSLSYVPPANQVVCMINNKPAPLVWNSIQVTNIQPQGAKVIVTYTGNLQNQGIIPISLGLIETFNENPYERTGSPTTSETVEYNIAPNGIAIVTLATILQPNKDYSIVLKELPDHVSSSRCRFNTF